MYYVPVVPDYHGVAQTVKGQTVQLTCRVAPGDVVTWIQVKNQETQFLYIFYNGKIHFSGLKDRYFVPNATIGDYMMTIQNIQPNDAGRYFCLRGNVTLKPHYVEETEHLLAMAVRLYIIYVKGKISWASTHVRHWGTGVLPFSFSPPLHPSSLSLSLPFPLPSPLPPFNPARGLGECYKQVQTDGAGPPNAFKCI